MEVWTVCQQGSNGRMLCGVPAKAAVLAVNARKMANDLCKADDSQARGIDDRFDALPLKSRSGTTIEPEVGQATGKRRYDARGVQITRRFPGRHQKLHFSPQV
jgi:hypothetical protein